MKTRGGRWWDAPVCWIRGVYKTAMLGTYVVGARVSGHLFREIDGVLVCDQCGARIEEVMPQ